jgi:hypothetical protein
MKTAEKVEGSDQLASYEVGKATSQVDVMFIATLSYD